MNRLLKISFIAFILLLMVLGVVTAALWYFVPREQVKEVITREISSRLNQHVTMSSFSFGLYPDLEFTARNMHIIDPPSSREIAAAEKIRFDLDMRQLLKRRVVIENVMLGSPRVALSRTADGIWNIADAVRNARAGTTADKTQSATGLQFKEITIKNGSISISDESLNQQMNLTNLAGTINLKDAIATITSASLETPSLSAELSGTISEIFSPDPLPDISANVKLHNDGPLADVTSIALPSGAKIADVTLDAAGSIKSLAIKTSFSINPQATSGLTSQGTINGTLETVKGLLTIATFDLRSGKSTFSLSGSANNLWDKERSVRLEGIATVSLDETIPLAENSTLSQLNGKGMADARISINAASGKAALTATVDLNRTSFSVPHLIDKAAGSPATLMIDAQLSMPGALIINDFELVIGENRITGTAEADPDAATWLRFSLQTSPLPLAGFDQLPSVRFEDGTITLTARAWEKSRTGNDLQYRAQALVRDGSFILKKMNEPFDKIQASIEAVNNRASIPEATFFLADMPCRLNAEIRNFQNPEITGRLYTNALDINALISAFRKKDKPPQELPEPAPAFPGFSLDMAVNTESLCFGKLRTGPVSAIWHTSGRLQRFEPLYADVFGGRLEGTLQLTFHKHDKRWHATFSGEEMDIETLCAQFFTGKVIATAKGILQAEGELRGSATRKKEEVWQSLQGEVRISATEGEIRQSALFNSILLALRFTQGIVPIPDIRDLNLVTMLRDVAKTLTRTLDVSRMVFKKIDGSFKIMDGIARTEDLHFVGEDADFAFSGVFDLVRNEMDITINVIPTGTIDTLVNKIPLVGKQIGRIKKATLSFNLIARGAFANPDVQLQAVDKILPD